MLPQHEPRVRHDDQDEVHSCGPQRADDHDAADAFGLQHAVAEARSGGCGGDARRADGDGLLARIDRHVDVRDVEGRGCEASGVVDHLTPGTGRLLARGFAVVLRDDEKPGDGEGGCVRRVDERVADVERGEREAVEGRLGADMARQQGRHDQRQQRVNVHGELQRREMEAGQESEKAVQPRDFVEQQGERDEFGAGA